MINDETKAARRGTPNRRMVNSIRPRRRPFLDAGQEKNFFRESDANLLLHHLNLANYEKELRKISIISRTIFEI
jgi:hypothetical protein